jgi:hypothetical protein
MAEDSEGRKVDLGEEEGKREVNESKMDDEARSGSMDGADCLGFDGGSEERKGRSKDHDRTRSRART